MTKLKLNETSTLFLGNVSKVLFEVGLIWAANFGRMLANNSLNLLHFSSLSIITLESTTILSNVNRFVFDLQKMSEYFAMLSLYHLYIG